MLSIAKNLKKKVFYSARPEICMDVGEWARQRGLPVTDLHPPLISAFEKYAVQDLVVKNEIEAHRNALERSQTLVPIEGAIVRDWDGIVELPDGQICYQGNWWLGYLQNSPTYRRRFQLRRRDLKGDFFSLISLWSSEYYHWFHDVLPRLYVALPLLPQNIKFLINDHPKEYQIKSLEAFGITHDRLVTQASRIYSKCERLWFASPLGHSGFTSGKILQQVAEKIRLFFYASLPETESKRLYISRQYASTRRVVNENKLAPILKNFGIQLICAENQTFLQQVANFSAADFIVGPHGAGLTNTMFCPSGSHILEIVPGSVPSCYFITCNEMCLHFERLLASPVTNAGANSDMRIEVDLFKKELSKYFFSRN
jgi:hypothetical protein